MSGVSFLTYTIDPYSLNTTVSLHIFLHIVFLCDSCYVYTFMTFIDMDVFMCKNSYKFINMENLLVGGQKQNAKTDREVYIMRFFVICSLCSIICEAKATEMR